MLTHSRNNCLRLNDTAGNTTDVVIRSQGCIKDFSPQEITSSNNEDTWLLYCLEDSGIVYCVHSQQVHDHFRLHANSVENQDIFSDLLEPKTTDSIDSDLVESTIPVYPLQTCHALYTTKGRPLSLCSHKDLLVLLTEDGDSYIFTGFRVLHDDGRSTLSDKAQKICFTKSNSCPDIESCPLKLVTCDIIDNEGCEVKSADTVSIDKNLFNCLFGSVTALVNSPVLMFYPPGGSVYCIPVNLLFSKVGEKHKLFHEGRDNTNKLWKLFCETPSNVTDILTLQVPNNSAEEGTNSNVEDDIHVLLVCCRNGRVISYHCDPSNRQSVITSELDIQGPVYCGATFCNRLYHSTLSHLYETSLGIVKSTKQRPDPQGNYKVSVKGKKQAMVYKIHAEAITSYMETEDQPCILHCIQRDGTYRVFNSSVLFDKDMDVTVDGLQIKDVLIAIDSTDRDQKQLNESLKRCDTLLEQVSLASFLFQRYSSQSNGVNLSNLKKDVSKLPFLCKYKVAIENVHRSGGQGHVDLHCEITNQMPRNLSHDWTLEVYVVPLSYRNNQSNINTTILPLVNGFKTKETISVAIAARSDLILEGFDVIVTLNLDISRVFPDTKQKKSFSVPVIQDRLDILHFLLPKQTHLGVTSNYKSTDKIERQVEMLALNHPSATCLLPHMKQTEPEHSTGSTVCLTKQLQISKTQLDQLKHQYGEAPACILEYLLRDSNLLPIDTVKNKCHVLTLTGSDLYLEILEGRNQDNKIDHRNNSGEVMHAVLSIQSDLSTAGAVSIAMDRKFNVFGSSSKPGFPTTVDLHRKLRHDLQNLEMAIESLSNKKLTDTEMEKEVGKLYQRLRSLQSGEQS